MSKHY